MIQMKMEDSVSGKSATWCYHQTLDKEMKLNKEQVQEAILVMKHKVWLKEFLNNVSIMKLTWNELEY